MFFKAVRRSKRWGGGRSTAKRWGALLCKRRLRVLRRMP
jgi:hypothetical protein